MCTDHRTVYVYLPLSVKFENGAEEHSSVRPLQVVNTVSGQGLSKLRGGRAGLVIVNMTTKILVAEQSCTHLVTKES